MATPLLTLSSEAPSGSLPRPRPRKWLAAVSALSFVLACVILATRAPQVEIASKHPFWIIPITGVTGDVAQVWIWTPKATLLTNLTLPAELRFSRHEFLVQVRSEHHRALELQLCDTGRTNCDHLSFNEGERGSLMAFSSVGRAPFLPMGEFVMEKMQESMPLGYRPVFKGWWSMQRIRIEPVPLAPAPK